MNKKLIIGAIAAGTLLIGVIGASSSNQPPNSNAIKTSNAASATKKNTEEVKPTCDGTTVTKSCMLQGVNYSSYIYHPAVAEKSHTETTTDYRKEVTSYCTLCDDGTYSPSCATGRGACSYHGGVAQWNAPVYSNVPVDSTKIVIDAPAQESFYEKITD
jgi:hypothetical protein